MGIQYLRCSGNLGPGIEVCPGIRLTSDPSRIPALKDADFIKMAGSLEGNFLLSCPLVGYSQFDIESNSTGYDEIAGRMRAVDAFLTIVWLFHDHTAFFDRGYLYFENGRISSSALVSSTYDRSGNRSSCSLSTAELTQAKHLFRILSRSGGNDFDHEKYTKQPLKSVAHRSISLCQRFFSFLKMMREAADPGLPVTFCVCGIEVLFSTGTSELTHRVCERIAFFFGKTPSEKRSLYQKVKLLYAVRSAFVHGDSLSKATEGQLSKIVADGEDLLRNLGIEALGNPSFRTAICSGKSAVEEFHQRYLFGDQL